MVNCSKISDTLPTQVSSVLSKMAPKSSTDELHPLSSFPSQKETVTGSLDENLDQPSAAKGKASKRSASIYVSAPARRPSLLQRIPQLIAKPSKISLQATDEEQPITTIDQVIAQAEPDIHDSRLNLDAPKRRITRYYGACLHLMSKEIFSNPRLRLLKKKRKK